MHIITYFKGPCQLFNVWDKEVSFRIRKAKDKNVRMKARMYNYTKYGLSLDEYNQLFIKQEGCCAICGTHQTTLKRRLAVDHCHDVGAVRGLLCTNCNIGLGMFKNDIKILHKAIQFLKGFKRVFKASRKAAGAFK